MKKFLCLFLLALSAHAEVSFNTLYNQSPVCFSPDETCDEKLAAFYDLAEKSIDVAVYDINRPRLVDALVKRSHEVAVRVVCDERQSKGSHSAVARLAASGVQIRFGRQKGIMHNKFSVIDNAVLETGSFNYTNHATIANQENQLYSIDPKIVQSYAIKFSQMWERAKPFGEASRKKR